MLVWPTQSIADKLAYFEGITCMNKFARESHGQDETRKRAWSDSDTTLLERRQTTDQKVRG